MVDTILFILLTRWLGCVRSPISQPAWISKVDMYGCNFLISPPSPYFHLLLKMKFTLVKVTNFDPYMAYRYCFGHIFG